MMLSEFYSLNNPAIDRDVEELRAPLHKPEPATPECRHMTYEELCKATPEAVQEYIAYIRTHFGVTNTELAATYGKERANVVKVLSWKGVPTLTQQEGCDLRARFNPYAWAAYVAGQTPAVDDRTAEDEDDYDDIEEEPAPQPEPEPERTSTGTIEITGDTNDWFFRSLIEAVLKKANGTVTITIRGDQHES